MSNNTIVTRRKFEKWPSWDVVFEWEDIMAETMNIDLEYVDDGFRKRIRNFAWYHLHSFSKFKISDIKDWKLVWVMSSKALGNFTLKNCIPIFLDVFIDDAEDVIKATDSLPCFWVTNYEFFNLLQKNGVENVFYMPLSISDKYITNTVPEKTIDVLQFGRKNRVLHKWMMDYCGSHNVEYIYREDNKLSYVSSLRGGAR